jgi:predicted CopG family antitoxin
MIETDEERKRINVTLSKDVHKVGLRLAKEDKRDFSHFIEVLIEREEKRLAMERSAKEEAAA